MKFALEHRICQGVIDAPPPPLAGALSAWLRKGGQKVRVIDPRGAEAYWAGIGPLWVHLEAGNWDRLRDQIPEHEHELYFFGPEADLGAADYPHATVVPSDPEGEGLDPKDLPITTYAGFGPQTGGLFRLLAGRYGQPRPLAKLLIEIVYLVETHKAGHFIFDDEDLSTYGDHMAKFEEELGHLPWSLTWEGRAAGCRVTSAAEIQPGG